jgi:hypothetical protein
MNEIWQWYPPVGVFIAILGLLGVLVPLFRDLAKIGKREKALWTAVLFLLVGLEIRSIYLERAEHDRKEAEARATQLKGFNDIAGGIKETIQQSQQQFAATMGGINQNIGTVTGADSFCYMIFSSDGIGASGVPTFVHVGKFPLTDVSARVVDLNNFNKRTAQGVTSLQQYVAGDIKVPIGNLAPATAYLNTLLTIPFSDRNSQDFRIIYDAKNGHWMEDLELRNTNGKWLQALRVRRLNGNQTPTIFRKVDKGFPLDSGGKVEWPK